MFIRRNFLKIRTFIFVRRNKFLCFSQVVQLRSLLSPIIIFFDIKKKTVLWIILKKCDWKLAARNFEFDAC